MIKAILFDMDGVLIDAKDWHYEALNDALNLFGYTISREAHLTTFDGLPTMQKLKTLSASHGLPEGLHEIINSLKQSYTQSIAYRRCKPTFNHLYAVSKLVAGGYKTGVCSNSVRQSVISMITLSGLVEYFDVILSNEDVALGKPDPEMYLKAMKRLGVKPNETLILEDNEHGIKAAVDSGAHLMKIGTPDDVTYSKILKKIKTIEEKVA